MLFVNAVDWCNTVKLTPVDSNAAFKSTGTGVGFGGGIAVPDSLSTAHGWTTALDAATGQVLYQRDTHGAMAGGVITYRAGGKQYVAVASGNTSFIAWTVMGKPTLVIFGL